MFCKSLTFFNEFFCACQNPNIALKKLSTNPSLSSGIGAVHKYVKSTSTPATKRWTTTGPDYLDIVPANGSVFLGRDYASPSNASSQIAYEIDIEVRKIIDKCHADAKKILLAHKKDLINIAEALIVNETLTAEEIDEIVKGMKITYSTSAPTTTEGFNIAAVLTIAEYKMFLSSSSSLFPAREKP